jgi:probable HAF family extracellular repeat protein
LANAAVGVDVVTQSLMSPINRVAIILGITCSLAGMAPLRANEQPPYSYTLTDLGTAGGPCSLAAAINNQGQVVGSTSIGPADDAIVSPFLYRNGVMTAITTAYGYATSINDAGQVTGFACRKPGPCYIERAFLYADQRLKFFGALHGPGVDPQSLGYGINNAGTIVGEANSQGMVIHHGKIYPFGQFGIRAITAINDANWVIGSLVNDHAFLFDGHQLHEFDTLEGAPLFLSRPGGINAAGEVVVSAISTGWFRGYSYKNGVMSDLGTLHPDGTELGYTSYTIANGINAAGDIVGESDGAAFLYRNGVMVDLNSLLPPDSPHVGLATGINDHGQIVGLVWTSPCGHAALLTPVPGTSPQ